VADTSDLDAAVINKLATDPVLTSTLPGGVGWDIASVPGATKFMIVSQVEHDDAYVMPGRGIARERIVYLVKAVTKGSSGTEVRAAAKRIQQLLQDQPLPVDGYTVIVVQRLQRIRYTEVDEMTDERWQHRGGHYEIQACPI
jgi:Protein of unknown function (DUF3168)